MIFASEGDIRIGRLTVTSEPQLLTLPSGGKNVQGVLVKVLGDNATMYLGVNASVSPSTGYPVSSGEEFALSVRETEKLWVVADESVEVAYLAL